MDGSKNEGRAGDEIMGGKTKFGPARSLFARVGTETVIGQTWLARERPSRKKAPNNNSG